MLVLHEEDEFQGKSVPDDEQRLLFYVTIELNVQK